MRRGRANQRGIALLLVLWIFMILGVLAIDFSRYMRDDAMAAVNFADETRGYYLALAGMNRAIFDAEQVREHGPGATTAVTAPRDEGGDEDQDLVPADGEWHEGVFAGGHYAVRMTDEGGRIALNHVEEALLTRVITNLLTGGNATASMNRHDVASVQTIVNSILDWRDADNLTRPDGAENDYYRSLPNPYRAKNGLFDSPEELLQVRGVTPELYFGRSGMPGLRDIVSVFNRSNRINVRTAPAVVLQVLLNVDADTATDLVAGRDAEGPAFLQHVQAMLTSIDPQLAETATDLPAHTVTLEARGDVQQARNQAAVAAVVDLSAEMSEGARVLRWLDRAPFGHGPPRADGGVS